MYCMLDYARSIEQPHDLPEIEGSTRTKERPARSDTDKPAWQAEF